MPAWFRSISKSRFRNGRIFFFADIAPMTSPNTVSSFARRSSWFAPARNLCPTRRKILRPNSSSIFDRVVQRLDTVVQQSVAAQTKSALDSRNRVLGTAGGLLLLLGVVGLLLVRDILGRLARLKAVSDRLALADISASAIEVSGNDEIAAFSGTMNGAH